MAVVQYKSAVYTIGPSSSQQFTFWWGPGSTGVEYFDVSIGVDPQPRHPTQLPLIEEQRAYLWDGSEDNPRNVLLLTLRNDNDFEVFFIANHVRIANF
jgi:hypothetical protein